MTPKHSVRLEVIDADLLDIDPDVQFAFALNERRWRQMGATWSSAKQGVLEVTSNGNGRYNVFDGRHRLLAGRDIAGVKEFRCNVHHPSLNAQEKAERKLGLDRDRRNVKTIESFLTELVAQDATALEIQQIAASHGYVIGKTGSSTANTIEAISTLRRAHKDGLLDRVLTLNTLWFSEPKTTSAAWLWSLLYFCQQGWDENLTSAHYDRLREVVPAVAWRKALAETTTFTTQSAGSGGETARRVAETLRKAAKIRKAR